MANKKRRKKYIPPVQRKAVNKRKIARNIIIICLSAALLCLAAVLIFSAVKTHNRALDVNITSVYYGKFGYSKYNVTINATAKKQPLDFKSYSGITFGLSEESDARYTSCAVVSSPFDLQKEQASFTVTFTVDLASDTVGKGTIEELMEYVSSMTFKSNGGENSSGKKYTAEDDTDEAVMLYMSDYSGYPVNNGYVEK